MNGRNTDAERESLVISFREPRSKPDHDPHGEVNAHLSAWSCPHCGTSGLVTTHDLDMLHLEDIPEERTRCEECAGTDTAANKADGDPPSMPPVLFTS